MKAYVVVEGPTDAAIVRAALPPHLLRATTVAAAGGRTNITSFGRSVVVTRRKPIVVLADADTVDERLIRERAQLKQELLNAAAAGTPAKVILAVPQIEAVFFQVPGLLPDLFGEAIPPEAMLVAQSKPKEVLDDLLKRSNKLTTIDALLGSLTDEHTQRLRMTPPMSELIAFLQESVEPTRERTAV